MKSKIDSLYKRFGWSQKVKNEDNDVIVKDQIQYEILTIDSIQMVFTTNVFSKKSEYMTSIKKCKKINRTNDKGIDKMVDQLMTSKTCGKDICKLCEDYDQMKVI